MTPKGAVITIVGALGVAMAVAAALAAPQSEPPAAGRSGTGAYAAAVRQADARRAATATTILAAVIAKHGDCTMGLHSNWGSPRPAETPAQVDARLRCMRDRAAMAIDYADALLGELDR